MTAFTCQANDLRYEVEMMASSTGRHPLRLVAADGTVRVASVHDDWVATSVVDADQVDGVGEIEMRRSGRLLELLELRVFDDAKVTVEDGFLTVAAGQISTRVPARRPEAPHPTYCLDAPTGEGVISAELIRHTKAVTSAASGDESRPLLTALRVESEDGHLRLVATDSYRLVVRDYPEVPWAAEPMNVPAGAVEAMAGNIEHYGGIDITLTWTADHLRLVNPATGFTVTAKLINMAHLPKYKGPDYPNYRTLLTSFMPDGPRRATFDRAGLAALVEAAHMTCSDSPLDFKVTDTITLSRFNGDAVFEAPSGATSVQGGPFTVGFHTNFLADALASFDPGERVEFHFGADDGKPCLITGDVDGLQLLLMPKRRTT